jgi:type I restriction enzyme, S subunit
VQEIVEMALKMAKLGSVAEILSGFAFKSEWFQSSGTPVIRIGDISNREVDASTCVSVDESKYRIPESCRTQDGDILMALSGATTGKIGIVQADLHGALVNQRVAIIRSFEPVTQQYIQYLFTGPR